MQTIKGILFDKDGTLIDFNRTWLARYWRAARYLHERYGERALPKELLAYGGFIAEGQTWQADAPLACASNEQIIALWEAKIGQPIDAPAQEKLAAIFKLPATAYVPVVADLAALLTELRDGGVKLGLATMDNQHNAQRMLSAVGIEQLFDFVCGADSGFGVKPEAGMVQAFCQACQLSSNQVMMVGDSVLDMEMGKAAAVALKVGVLSGAHNATVLAPHADLIVQSIAELPSVMKLNSASNK